MVGANWVRKIQFHAGFVLFATFNSKEFQICSNACHIDQGWYLKPLQPRLLQIFWGNAQIQVGVLAGQKCRDYRVTRRTKHCNRTLPHANFGRSSVELVCAVVTLTHINLQVSLVAENLTCWFVRNSKSGSVGSSR